MNSFYEFFAGGGMAAAGLGSGWHCLFANDFCPKKARAYTRNWGASHLLVDDVAKVTTSELPGRADLAWASFPCQDLSIAGSGKGLSGERSGSFWQFWRLIDELKKEGRPPQLVVLENVCGLLTSREGADFTIICEALVRSGYVVGAVVMDAVHFVPQSRPRLFIVGWRQEGATSLPGLHEAGPRDPWHPGVLVRAHGRLPEAVKKAWIWWQLPAPPARSTSLADLIEKDPHDVSWHSEEETGKLLGMMDETNLRKVREAQASGLRTVGTVYRRTRRNRAGRKILRAEIRTDGVAGCLRTPSGGSSRQIIMVIEGSRVRSRLLSPREAARLMGLPECYELPERYNEAYHLAGDGVVVPVVRFLAENLLEKLLEVSGEVNRDLAA